MNSNIPWHIADMDGLYVVRGNDEAIIFEHSQTGERETKIAHCNLVSVAPEMLSCRDEFIALLERAQPGPKAFITTGGDIQRARDRAVTVVGKARGI